MKEIIRGKILDIRLEDVQEVYEGPVGVLWEMLMGEEIHVGGADDTEILANKAKITKQIHVLDVCSALGGPARHLARKFGCSVTGLDATRRMFEEAIIRTERDGLSHLVSNILGNCLDMPFEAETFDVVWGQDAWCYVTDKKKLLQETARVLKPRGINAFTDWIQTGTMRDTEWEALNKFMVFPYMETLDGYEQLLRETGFVVMEKDDLSKDFVKYCQKYQNKLVDELRDKIIKRYGNELFKVALEGLDLWVSAADEGKVGRGRWIAKKARTD